MQAVFEVIPSQRQEIIDITDEVNKLIKESQIKEGLCLVYTPHATAAIIINENHDLNIGTDLINCLNNLAPQGKWLHDQVDGNADAHLKAAILGPSETLIIENNTLVLGQWQSLMLASLDGPRIRKIMVKVI